MPVKMQRLPDEPIVIAELQERMDLESIRAMFEETAKVAAELNCVVYRISNYLNVEVSFSDMATALAEGSKGAPGSPRDPRIQAIMVAGRNRVRFLFEALRRKEFGGIDVPVFDTMEEALFYARCCIRDGRVPRQYDAFTQ